MPDQYTSFDNFDVEPVAGFSTDVFADAQNAWLIFSRLKNRYSKDFIRILPWLNSALGNAADPDRSLVLFERMAESYGEEFFHELAENPRLIEMLTTLFSNSSFLTEILLSMPDAIDLLKKRENLIERKTVEQFTSESGASFQKLESNLDKLNALRRYQRRQLLRIGISDFLDLFDLRTVVTQLSRLAVGMTRTCLTLASEQTGVSPSGFSVIALGKLGSRELNYSSDIDLLFLAKSDHADFTRLGKQLIENISKTTNDGFLYRVDMRLRPWGHDGALVTTIEGFTRYFQQSALLWEKQAFLKARPIAGNLGLGEELRLAAGPYIYGIPAEEVRAGIYSMKQRTEEFLFEKGRHWGEVKLGEGSIRDVEFVVQCLQLTHPSIHTRRILKAIPLLRDEKLITPEDARTLSEGYIFLRTIEHYLQITDYQQTYSLPSDPNALSLLARRLGFEGEGAGERFTQAFEKRSQAIRAIYMKVIGKTSESAPEMTMEEEKKVQHHIARMDAAYAKVFTNDEISFHTRMVNQVSHEKPVLIDASPEEGNCWRVTVVGFDYLGVFSLICGLLYLYGLNILDSQAFTYETFAQADSDGTTRKIVDVFLVEPVNTDLLDKSTWERYADDLLNLVQKVQTGSRREAQISLAKRVGAMVQVQQVENLPLYPIDIEIDNISNEKYTVLKIGSPDTAGFLYEFSNALALSHINVVRVLVQTINNRAQDVLFVTDEEGHKIKSEEKQRELRAAAVLIKHFTHLLPQSPNPASALLHFREFLHQLFERPNWVDEFAKIERPEVLSGLAKLLGVSDFLWDDFLRMQYGNLFPIVRDVHELESAVDRKQLEIVLQKDLKEHKKWREAVNIFKDREMFRIDMRHILGYSPEFGDFSRELTDLVEVTLNAIFKCCFHELVEKHGQPKLDHSKPCPAVLMALGKCGGRELGFASDIEIMFLYEAQGNTNGKKSIATSLFYEEMVQEITRSIQARQEGVFHLDLQLRPYGKAGSQAVSLEAFTKYYSPSGAAWPYERQALVKMRPIAGDLSLGEKLCSLRDEFVYNGTPFDVTSMRAMRERQVRHLVNVGTFNAKFSPGGLVDLEYLIQGMQINIGANDPSVRLTNIRETMAALCLGGHLSTTDYDRLRKAHTFLRWLIDSLRVVRGNAKDVNIPSYDSDEFAYLARRLRYGSDVNQLAEDLNRYSQDVQEISLRLLPE